MSFFERLMFPPFAPDLSDQETQTSQTINNVVPRADGYGPFPDFQAFSQSLPNGVVYGAFFARNADGTITIFAGDLQNLYVLNNSTLAWTNVTNGGTNGYTALSPQAVWQFEQFDNYVIAVQANATPQYYQLQVSTAFANLSSFPGAIGTPPNAAYVAVVNRFVMLSGLPSNLYRVQWSDLDAPATWTAGTGQADFQDLPDGGNSKAILGFDLYGVIFQDNVARLLTYTAGSPVVFTITKITGGDGNGIFAPYGAEIDQDNVFWISQEGFKMMAPGGAPTPIGKEIVDRYFFANVDSSNLGMVVFSTDPTVSRLYIAFKSIHGQAGAYDTILVYDWELQKWTIIAMSGQYMLPISKPGTTEEGLDAITPGAVSITGASIGGSNGAGGNYIRLQVTSTAFLSGSLQQTGPWNNAVATPASGGPGFWNITQLVSTGSPSLSAYLQYYLAQGKMGLWRISIIDGTHVDLTAGNSGGPSVWQTGFNYVSGGILGGNEDLFPFSYDSISTAFLPQFANFQGGVLGFHTGPFLAATLDTAEQGTNAQRMRINGLRIITDASTATACLSYRESPSAPISYSALNPMNSWGVSPQRVETRYARARVVIPYGSTWTYIQGVEPDGILTGIR